MRRRTSIARLVLMLLPGVACGVSSEKVLQSQPPVKEARVDTFGWSRSLGLGQEIRVVLEPGAAVSQVADLSVFAPFQPGMTHEEAVAAAGAPTGTWKDAYGQLWYRYDRPSGTIKIGCTCFSSGDSVSSNCTWQLSAVRRDTSPVAGLSPQLVSFVASARQVPERVDYRMLEIITSDYTDAVTWPIETQDSVLTLSWRRGPGRKGGACRGGAG